MLFPSCRNHSRLIWHVSYRVHFLHLTYCMWHPLCIKLTNLQVSIKCEQWHIYNLARGREGVRPLPLVLRGQFLLNYNNFVRSENTISEHMAIFKENICKFFKYLQNFFRFDIHSFSFFKHRINMGNACNYSLQKILSSRLHSKKLKVKTYKTIILPVVLYGCETWSLTLRGEHRLRVFENKVLRKIFVAKKDEITGEWRKLHNAELHAFYSSSNIIRRTTEMGRTRSTYGAVQKCIQSFSAKA